MSEVKNLHPQEELYFSQQEKEAILGQKGVVLWLYGLSGSGKSTLARELEVQLWRQGHPTVILDGDRLRTGLNSDLGFSKQDRMENIRRFSELAKLLVSQGLIVIVSAITPFESLRKQAKSILGESMIKVYVKASFEVCAKRDPKGIYAKAAKGEISNFTGKDSDFEEPKEADEVIDTQQNSLSSCLGSLRSLLDHFLTVD